MCLFRYLFIIAFFQNMSLFALSEVHQADAEQNYRDLLALAGVTGDDATRSAVMKANHGGALP